MFTNVVTATVDFDYQGQHYALKNVIDIDYIIHHEDFFNSVYLSIAKANNIDLYSYQLEILIDQNIVFSNEKGCVQGCVNNGEIDLDLLKENQLQAECLPKVEGIMHKYFTKDQHSDEIIQALIEAYLEGKK
jgi:hypothetical protein